MAPAKKINTYTYQDYKNFDDSMRCEIFEGEVMMMSPAPNMWHQAISSNLHFIFSKFLKGNTCKAYSAPVDVLLDYKYKFEHSNIILQPDLLVLCDKNKWDKRGILGAPELVIEILSPSTLKNDIHLKYILYRDYGVKEYWIVNPDARTIHQYFLVDGDYEEFIYYSDDKDKNVIKSRLFEGLEIPLSEIFEYGFGN